MNVEILQDGGQRREEGRCQQLAQVLSITLRMLEKAREDDWQTVADLEHKRRELLALCFRGAATPEQSELVAESLAVMLHLNEELMSLLRVARDSVLQKANLQSQTRTALGEYVVVQHQATRSAD